MLAVFSINKCEIFEREFDDTSSCIFNCLL